MEDAGAVLDFDVIADVYVGIDINMFSNDAILSNNGPVSDLYKMPDPVVCYYWCLWRHLGGGMNSGIFVDHDLHFPSQITIRVTRSC